MGLIISAEEAARVIRWAPFVGKRGGQSVSSKTIRRFIIREILPATRSSVIRRTRRTITAGQTQEDVIDTSEFEIDIDDLLKIPTIVIDERERTLLEAERQHGEPDAALRRVSVTEDRLTAAEKRISELEQEREDLMHRIISLEADRTTMRQQIAGILLARSEKPQTPLIPHYDEYAPYTPDTRLDDHESVFTDNTPSESSSPFIPIPAEHSGPARPLFDNVMSQIPSSRSDELRRDRRPSHRPDARRTTDTPEIPDDLFGFNRLLEAHGISATTAKAQWQEQRLFQVLGPYKIGRGIGYGIDEENAEKAVRTWIHFGRTGAMKKVNMASFGNCGLTTANGIGCPCYRILSLAGSIANVKAD